MKRETSIYWVTLLPTLVLTALGACGHVDEPRELEGEPDGGTDSDADSDGDSDSDGDTDTGTSFGDPGCVELPYPVPHQRHGIVSVGSAGPGHSYAVDRECDLYHYEGDEWIMVNDREPFFEDVLDCESVLVPQPNHVIDVGGQGSIDFEFFATVEWYDEEDILDGYSGLHAHGCIPSASSTDENSACAGADPGDAEVCGAWIDGVWGPDADDYLVVGGWAVGDSGCNGDSTMDGFWFNPTRGFMAHCHGGCYGMSHAPDAALRDVWGVSTSDYYVIGNRLFTDFESSDYDCVEVESYVHRCDDSSCDLEVTVYGMLLNGIWGTSMDDVFAVGGYWNNGDDGGNLGAIALHKGSAGWSQMSTGTDVALWDVWGADGEDVYAVGGHETSGGGSTVTLHYDGESWTELDIGATKALYGVHGDSAGNVHVVGWEGFFHIAE